MNIIPFRKKVNEPEDPRAKQIKEDFDKLNESLNKVGDGAKKIQDILGEWKF